MKLKETPYDKFPDEREFQEVCKWWQKRLNLEDWIIEFKLSHEILYDSNDIQVQGCTSYDETLKCAIISITDVEYAEGSIKTLYLCSEQTVVHELLHLCLSLHEYPTTYDGKCAELINHRQVEFLARSFVEVRCRLEHSYWRAARRKELKNEQ